VYIDYNINVCQGPLMASIATLIFSSTVLPRKTVTKEPQYIHVYSTNSILFQFVCSILGFIFISVAVLMKKTLL